MAASRISGSLALLSVFSSTALSLYVVPDSDCAALCTNGTSTTPSIESSDVVCVDDDFSEDGAGIRFRNCIECLRESEAEDGDDSDIQFMLYNMRYAMNACLFDQATRLQSPCILTSACEPLEDAIATGLSDPGEQHYDYCSADDGSFEDSQWPCTVCLNRSEEQTYFANFMQALMAGCEQRPDLGETLTMRGQIFSDDLLNITVTNTTLPGEGGASSSDMTTGTIVGIAVGGALGVLGVAALVWVCCRRRRKRKAQEANDAANNNDMTPDNTPPPDTSNASTFTAMSRSPRYLGVGSAGDHRKSLSVRSAEYELQEKQHPGNNHGNNADYYDRQLEKEMGGAGGGGIGRPGRTHAHLDPRSQQQTGALPPHPAYDPRSTIARDAAPPNPSMSAAARQQQHRRTGTSDSYAIQAYLNATDSASDIRHPPSTHSRSRSATPSGRGTPSDPGVAGRPSAERSNGPATNVQGVAVNIPPPPPGPPPAANGINGTSLAVPSVPRIKVPQKSHSPPAINVEGATPIDDDSGEPDKPLGSVIVSEVPPNQGDVRG